MTGHLVTVTMCPAGVCHKVPRIYRCVLKKSQLPAMCCSNGGVCHILKSKELPIEWPSRIFQYLPVSALKLRHRRFWKIYFRGLNYVFKLLSLKSQQITTSFRMKVCTQVWHILQSSAFGFKLWRKFGGYVTRCPVSQPAPVSPTIYMQPILEAWSSLKLHL